MEIKRYSLAILGGFLGGMLIIGLIVLMKLYSPINFPLISFFIAPFVNKGYRLFKGRVNKKLANIVIIVSVVALVILYFLIYPLLSGSLVRVLELSYWKSMVRDIVLTLVGAICGIYKTYIDILHEVGLRY